MDDAIETPDASPGDVALAWVQSIREARFHEAWKAMTDEFRLVCVQNWIVHNPTSCEIRR